MTRAALLTSSAFLTVAWIVPCAPWHALATTRGHRSAVNMMARPKGASKAVRREKLLENMDSGPSRSKPDGKWEDDPSTPLALLAVRAGEPVSREELDAAPAIKAIGFSFFENSLWTVMYLYSHLRM